VTAAVKTKCVRHPDRTLTTMSIGVSFGGGGQMPPPQIFVLPKNRFFWVLRMKRGEWGKGVYAY